MARLFDDASLEYLRVGTPAASLPFALSAWFYCDDLTNNAAMFGMSSEDANARNGHWLSFIGGAGGDPIQARQSSTTTIVWAQSTTGCSLNTWHHGCALYVSTTDRRVLLDNAGKGTNSTNNVAVIDNTSVGAAYYWTGAVNEPEAAFSGRVAECAIYDLSAWPGATDSDKADAFEASAIPVLAKGYSPPFVPLGLVGYWPLIRDEDQDRVGSLDMTAFNTPSVASHAPVIYPSHGRL